MMRASCLRKSCLDGDGMFSGINGVKTVTDLRFCKGGLGVP
jgi:hypothetical protein